MTELKIDKDKMTISATLMLDGEKEPILVQVIKYQLAANGELRLSGVSVSRPWMNLLAQELIANKSWPIPSNIAALLRIVL